MKKKRAGTHKRKLIDTPFTKYIFRISLFRKYIHSSQIDEHTKVIQEVVSPGIFNFNDLAPDKKQGNQTQFFPKKTLEK